MNEFIMLTQYYNGKTMMFRTDSILCAIRCREGNRTNVANKESTDPDKVWVVNETPEEIYNLIYGIETEKEEMINCSTCEYWSGDDTMNFALCDNDNAPDDMMDANDCCPRWKARE